MTLRHCIYALLVVVLAAATPSFAAPRAKAPQGSEGPAANAGPIPVLDDIEEGWASGDADLILRHFGANKVTIVIDGSGPGGSYSKDQGYYLFKELFKATVTKKFVFVQIRNNDENASTFAIAERRYQRRDDGRQVKDKVYISLHQEHDDGRWVVDEIKSIR